MNCGSFNNTVYICVVIMTKIMSTKLLKKKRGKKTEP